jgi:hypothetical protein
MTNATGRMINVDFSKKHMRTFAMTRTHRTIHLAFQAALYTATILLLSNFAHAQAAGQKTFASSGDAVTAFISAVRGGDSSALLAILGPGSEQIVASSDSVADKTARQAFVKWYDEGHTLVASADGEMILQVGKDNWPLAIPLTHAGTQWYWDGAAGKEEILYRRIGHNELSAIRVCNGVVAAQKEYSATGHDGQPAGAYAQHFASQPGKQDGLYWPSKEGEATSPAGPFLAQAAQEGYDTSGKRVPYHGYFYRMLPVSSGYAFLAYPADYRSSGVMTFVVSQKGIVYQKDLGPDTVETALKLASYSPDATWGVVK